jgi:hypothetical protein
MNFLQFLKESREFDAISKNDYLVDFLLNLVDDKDFVMKNNKKEKELEIVFKLFKNNTHKGILYRGVYKSELHFLKENETVKFNKYLSFSEDVNIAKNFTDCKTILIISDPKGFFPYSNWLINHFKKNKEDYENFDGERKTKITQKEKEWIANFDESFHVTKILKNKNLTEVHLTQK